MKGMVDMTGESGGVSYVYACAMWWYPSCELKVFADHSTSRKHFPEQVCFWCVQPTHRNRSGFIYKDIDPGEICGGVYIMLAI
jgi:hypothetical protein